MKLLFGHSNKVAEFVANLIPGMERGFRTNKAIGVINKDGKLIGGLVFTDWNPDCGTIELSAGAIEPRWLTRKVIRFCGDYAFNQCGCQMLIVRTDARNTNVSRILSRFGWTKHRISRMCGRGLDGLIFTLTDDQWRGHPFNKGSD